MTSITSSNVASSVPSTTTSTTITATPVTSPSASPFLDISLSAPSSTVTSPVQSDSDSDSDSDSESDMGAGTSKKNYLPVFLTHSASTQQGRRQYNEDRYDVRHPLVADKKIKDQSCSMFGVYDGHGGEWTAEYCEKHLHTTIAKQATFRCSTREKAIARGFAECDEAVLCEQETSGERSGTTAVVVLIDHDYIYSGNAGDSRAVLCRNGVAIELSQDHKPTDPEEKKRIEAAGGRVPGNYAELHDKGLAVSRAIGNLVFKQNPAKKQHEQIIVCTPHLAKVRRCRQDDFVLLASDGLWNIMDNQRACDYVRTRLADGMDPEEIVNKLTQFALDRKSQDNVTAVLVVFEYDDEVSQASRRKREEKKEEKKRIEDQREADRARQRELVMKEREERWQRQKAEEAARELESKSGAVASDPVIPIDPAVTSSSTSEIKPADTGPRASVGSGSDSPANATLTAGAPTGAGAETHPNTPIPSLRTSESHSSTIPRLKIHSSSSAHDTLEHHPPHDIDTSSHRTLRTVSDVSVEDEPSPSPSPNDRRGRGRYENDGLHSIPDTQRGMFDHQAVMAQVQERTYNANAANAETATSNSSASPETNADTSH